LWIIVYGFWEWFGVFVWGFGGVIVYCFGFIFWWYEVLVCL
jgi:hypothetical protein